MVFVLGEVMLGILSCGRLVFSDMGGRATSGKGGSEGA